MLLHTTSAFQIHAAQRHSFPTCASKRVTHDYDCVPSHTSSLYPMQYHVFMIEIPMCTDASVKSKSQVHLGPVEHSIQHRCWFGSRIWIRGHVESGQHVKLAILVPLFR